MPESLPSGLVFFSAGLSPARRRRRLLFAVLMGVALLALIWPVYPLFAAVRPFVLGLPFSLFWIVVWLFIVFGALVYLYRRDIDA